jgi:hypothetical protein
MSRRPFELSDDQARSLGRLVDPLLAAHKLDPFNHRPFTAAFVRAVYQATGRTYGPVVYRRLLKAYAPGRNPSTSTLVTEKTAFERELSEPRDEGQGCAAGGGQDWSLKPAYAPVDRDGVKLAVRDALESALPPLLRRVTGGGRDAEFNFMQHRLQAAEGQLAEVQAQAAQLASGLQEKASLAQAYLAEIATLKEALASQDALNRKLVDQAAGSHTFALQAIELARSETRQAKERCAQLEAALKERDTDLNLLRRTYRGEPR